MKENNVNLEMYLKMKTKVIKFCEGCLYGVGYGFMIAMGLLIICSISFAFYNLFLELFS